MLEEAMLLPDDPGDVRALVLLLIAKAKAQAVLIETLRHQLVGHRAHRFGPSGESAEQLALETCEVASAAIMGRLRLSEDGLDEEPEHGEAGSADTPGESRPAKRPLHREPHRAAPPPPSPIP